jgi:fructose-1,6-bisphosphatase/inositol monophosphatase family enzyme
MDDSFFRAAEKRLMNVLNTIRPELLAVHGNVEFTEKADNQGPVTVFDKKVEELLRAELLKLDSTIGVTGEELGAEGSATTYWTIDPIDGTKAFIRGLPFCSNMLSLVENGDVKYALVYQFVTDTLYTAQVGYGAFINGQKATIKKRPLDQVWLISHAGIKKYNPLLLELSQKIERVVIGSNIMAVTNGSIDAYMSVPDGSLGGIWDYAPRALIYNEAGAKVTNIGSETYVPEVTSLLAAHPSIFDQLHGIILSAAA